MKRNKFLEESAQWDARQEFMRFVLELINNMYLDKREGNLEGYQTTFRQLYLLAKPYIGKHFTDPDYKLFSMEDINEAWEELRPSITDHGEKENQYITFEIRTRLEEKEERMYELLAKERLLLPIGMEKEYIPPGESIRKKFRM